ncbi:pyridoxal-phosphate dependent enzyme [Acinetobacter pittii]|uniref:pyridoxal-phosphate dependent enzyme n=1 Tax=Acinetobacter pittii TaxID=48296 RepID=UPI0035A3B741
MCIVDCGEEIKIQSADFKHIFTAVGSGGTMAGLVYSLGEAYIHGVDAGAVTNPEERVRGLLSEMSGNDFTAHLSIRRDQVGNGYGYLTESVKEALHLVAMHSGIILDPIYTGRAFAGLIAAIREGSIKPGEKTIFLHSGGLPGFFGNPDVLNFAQTYKKTKV